MLSLVQYLLQKTLPKTAIAGKTSFYNDIAPAITCFLLSGKTISLLI